MVVKKLAKTVAKSAPAAHTASAPVKRAPKAKAAPKPAITLPEDFAKLNRTSLTALAKRLGMDIKAKFATRGEGRQAIKDFASVA